MAFRKYVDLLQNPSIYGDCKNIQSDYEMITSFAAKFAYDLVLLWFPDPLRIDQSIPLNDYYRLVLIQFPENKWGISLFGQNTNPLNILRFDPTQSKYILNERNIQSSDLVKKNFDTFLVFLSRIKSSEKPNLYLQLKNDNSYSLAISYDEETAKLTTVDFPSRIGSKLIGNPILLKLNGTLSTLFTLKTQNRSDSIKENYSNFLQY